jgi:hypothetical protein
MGIGVSLVLIAVGAVSRSRCTGRRRFRARPFGEDSLGAPPWSEPSRAFDAASERNAIHA